MGLNALPNKEDAILLDMGNYGYVLLADGVPVLNLWALDGDIRPWSGYIYEFYWAWE